MASLLAMKSGESRNSKLQTGGRLPPASAKAKEDGGGASLERARTARALGPPHGKNETPNLQQGNEVDRLVLGTF